MAERPAGTELLDVLEATGSFVLWFDEDGTVTRASAASMDVLGLRPDQVVGLGRADLIHPDDHFAAVDPVTPVLGSADPSIRRVLRWRHADGSWRWIESRPVDARHDPRSGSLIAILRDVTVETLVRKVGEVVAQRRGLEPAFDVIAERLGDVLPHHTALLSVITPEGVRVRAVRGPIEARRFLDHLAPLTDEARAQAERLTGVVHCPDTWLTPGDSMARTIAPNRSYAVFPIRVGGELVASVTLISREPGLDGRERLLLVNDVVEQTGGLLFLLADLARQRVVSSQLRDRAREAKVEARTDPLTGLANRRAWEEGLADLLTRAAMDEQSLTVVMLDLDGLKAVNDAQGHQAGDALLRALGGAWRSQVRPGDLFARYGGDEFALALWGCPAGNAAEVVSGLSLRLPEGCSVSAGIASWDGDETSDHLLGRADGALYVAKRNGRGLTVLAGDQPDAAESVESTSAKVLRLPMGRTASSRR